MWAEGGQARLHNLTKSGSVRALLAALAAHLRRELLEFAVERVRGRGERVAKPGRAHVSYLVRRYQEQRLAS